jgi:glycosyltransferase involved in cell wall biosynthesis
MELSIVVPLLNEKENLTPLMEAIVASLDGRIKAYEVIFIDDGSTDGSFETVRGLRGKYPAKVRAFRFSRNYGKSAALSVGIGKARGDVIVTMDADLQDDPAAIPDMLGLLDQGWDLVSGWKKKRHDPITFTLPSKIWNACMSVITGVKLHDLNCGFKAYRSNVAKSLEIYGERHRYLPALAHWDGYRVTEMPVPHHPRKFGKSKYGFSKFYKGIFDLLTILFLRKYMKNPMHFFGVLGILFALLGGGVLVHFGVQWLITGHMHLRPLVLLAIGSIIMGIQLMSIGLICELLTNLMHQDEYTIREMLESAEKTSAV